VKKEINETFFDEKEAFVSVFHCALVVVVVLLYSVVPQCVAQP
jgi:hypothetical protein